jgi:hypothetical protein
VVILYIRTRNDRKTRMDVFNSKEREDLKDKRVVLRERLHSPIFTSSSKNIFSVSHGPGLASG